MYAEDMPVLDQALIEEVRTEIRIESWTLDLTPNIKNRWVHHYNLPAIREILVREHPWIHNRLKIESDDNLVLYRALPEN